MYITVKNISYTYPDSSVMALDKVSITLAAGWTGIVGANGSGKSTLLKILCGTLSPNEGSCQPSIQGEYCAQSTDSPPAHIEEFALDYSPEAIRLSTSLELEDDWFWRFDTLSHGERKRIQIACALHRNPAILALDEPTNHLDALTRDIVLRTLLSFRGVGLIVSHDRTFLDKLAYQCLFLESGAGLVIPGGYTAGKHQLDLNNQTASSDRKKAKGDLARVQVEAHRRKSVAQESTARRSGKSLEKHDNDGREKLRLAIVSGQDGKTGLLSSQMNKKTERAQQRLGDAFVRKIYDKPLDLHADPSKRKIIAQLPAGIIALGESRKLHHPALCVGPTDKIGLCGRNGSGKTTLLKVLFDEKDSDQDRLLIPQEISPAQGRAIIAAIKKLPPQELGRGLAIVARLNSPPKRILSGEDLSPGELRKVMLAFGLLKNPNVIVMDEPTNHLDIHSIEALQAVLTECPCALLLVSHDEQFLNILTRIQWEFKSLLANSKKGAGQQGDTAVCVSLR